MNVPFSSRKVWLISSALYFWMSSQIFPLRQDFFLAFTSLLLWQIFPCHSSWLTAVNSWMTYRLGWAQALLGVCFLFVSLSSDAESTPPCSSVTICTVFWLSDPRLPNISLFHYAVCSMQSYTSCSLSAYTALMLWVNGNLSIISSLWHSATNPLAFWAVLYSPWFRFRAGIKSHISRNFSSASEIRLISLVRLQNS